jgi:hypothetical protein
MKIYNTSRDFKATRSPKKKVKSKKSFHSNLSTNYELMLRIYLADKQNKLAKEKFNSPRFTEVRKESVVKTLSSSIWNNLTQVVHRANHFITTWSSPKVEMLTK